MEAKFSREQAERILKSPEGQELLALLSGSGGLQKAAEAFRKGDMAAAQEALRPALQTGKAEALLQKLEKSR